MYDKYGPDMTAAEFHKGLSAVIDQLDAAQQAGQNISLKHGHN
jgi:hypothetical protein